MRPFYLSLLLFLALDLPAADFSAKWVEKAPPKEADPAMQKLLQPKALQILKGEQTQFECWFVSEVGLQSKPNSPSKALDTVKPATLLAVVSVPKARRDYRDDEVPAGVYTARFALQPQDGNHLGSAEFLYFLVLTPAKADTKPDGITDYKTLVKLSSKETSSDHPMIMSLRPVAKDPEATLQITEPAAEHHAVAVSIPAKAGADKTNLPFELVIEGKGKE